MDKLRAAGARVTARVASALAVTSPRSRVGRASEVGSHERGQGLAEYALILAGIAIVAIASLLFLGGTISDLFWAPVNEEFAEVLSLLGI